MPVYQCDQPWSVSYPDQSNNAQPWQAIIFQQSPTGASMSRHVQPCSHINQFPSAWQPTTLAHSYGCSHPIWYCLASHLTCPANTAIKPHPIKLASQAKITSQAWLPSNHTGWAKEQSTCNWFCKLFWSTHQASQLARWFSLSIIPSSIRQTTHCQPTSQLQWRGQFPNLVRPHLASLSRQPGTPENMTQQAMAKY